MKDWVYKLLFFLMITGIVLVCLAVIIIPALIMFKVIPAPEWLWWLVVIRG